MKVGLDIHGVVDRYPELFSKLSEKWVGRGWEVHIVTGQEWEKAEPTVAKAFIQHTHHFSIVDHHRKLGTPMYQRTDKEGWWMDRELWARSKGDYAASVGLDLHFDDYIGYAQYFPKCCTYVIVQSGFEAFYSNFLSKGAKQGTKEPNNILFM